MKMQVPFTDVRALNAEVAGELERSMAGVMASGDFVGGEAVLGFEQAFARYCEAQHCAAVSNGTDALYLALRAVGVGQGDEVVTVSSTYAATVEAIMLCGARPVFVDVRSDTYTMDAAQLESALTERTKAVLPVHLFGHPADLNSILALTRPRQIAVVEDASQAHGARYQGRRIGGHSDAVCFSFYPAKNLGACGDAGAVVTNSEAVYATVQQLKNHGQNRIGSHERFGLNARMDALQAAALSVKLPRLDGWNQQRRELAARYHELLSELPVVTPVEADDCDCVYHVYAVRVPQRDAVLRAMIRAGIDCRIHYPVPVHQQPFCRTPVALPVSEQCAAEFLSLPLFPGMTGSQVDCVIAALRMALAEVADVSKAMGAVEESAVR